MVSHLINTVASYAQRLAIIGGKSLAVGPVEEVLTTNVMSTLYGTPVQVRRTDGQVYVRATGSESEAEAVSA
jgi:zinc/manganese transport system ATP-binding protein